VKLRKPFINPDDARAIASEAYIYGFPLVDNYRIQYSYFVDRSDPEYKASWNTIKNNARVYTPADKAIQTPNSDTPYSQLGADLRAEPLVLTMPAVEKERYFSAQFIDLYTFNFAYVSSRTTGNNGGKFLLAGPRWKGQKPAGIQAVIQCETDFAFVLYRTQLFRPDDIDNVQKIQAGYKVQPLSAFLAEPAPPAPPIIDFLKPLRPTEERISPVFFDVLNFVLQFCPIHPDERDLMSRFARLGIEAGKSFDPKALLPEIRNAVEEGIKDAWDRYTQTAALFSTGKMTSADVFGTREHLKGNYIARMIGAVDGIYGNSKEEAFYPAYLIDSSGQKLEGSNRYTLRFAPGQFPPVNAFWSLTMYELPSRWLVANQLNRYLINSAMLPDLKRDADGGLTIYIRHDSPGTDKISNWLPAPANSFLAALRLYWPKSEVFNGQWKQPPLERQSKEQEMKRRQPHTGSAAIPVTADNFNRAETDMYFASIVELAGGVGRFHHYREFMPISRQDVVRANRDTLYSAAVFDLDAGPVTLTLPNAGRRFMSMMAIDQDHYALGVVYGAGEYNYSKAKIGTRYLMLAIRTLVDPLNPKDMKEVHALQDAVKTDQERAGTFEVPDWDRESQSKLREALTVLGHTIPDSRRMFGARGQVDPVRHLIGTAIAWGGNPEREAVYLNVTPEKNDGKTIYKVDIKSDVPVDGFWSVSVYNAAGYFEKNKFGAYSINSITGRKKLDGSLTIQFGGCDGKIPNCLPIMPGWNYMVRLYRPHDEILNGKWDFPHAQPAAPGIQIPPAKTA
jgi:hypothetical protein